MRRVQGFTLVELLVVFAILALVAALAPVAFDRLRDSAQYRDTVRTMQSQMRSARFRAMAEGKETRFVVDSTLRAYGAEDAPLRPLPASLQVKTVVAGSEVSAQGRAAIRFLADGGATGGSVEVIRPSGAGTRLRVDWLSGRVTQEALLP